MSLVTCVLERKDKSQPTTQEKESKSPKVRDKRVRKGIRNQRRGKAWMKGKKWKKRGDEEGKKNM